MKGHERNGLIAPSICVYVIAMDVLGHGMAPEIKACGQEWLDVVCELVAVVVKASYGTDKQEHKPPDS